MRMFALLQSGAGMTMIALVVIVHGFFALAIKRDARRTQMQRGLFLVGPGIWAFATLLGGITVVVAYWAIHYSTLKPEREDTDIHSAGE